MSLNVDLIKGSFEALKPHAEAFSSHFYKTLFKKYPEAFGLFENVDMEEQKKALVVSLSYCVDNLEDSAKLEKFLTKLGTRHVKYSTEEIHFTWVGEALLETLSYFFEENWTAEAEESWTMVYGVIVDFMKKGMRQKTEGKKTENKKIANKKAENKKMENKKSKSEENNTIELEELKQPGLADFARAQAQQLFEQVLKEELATKPLQKMVRERAREILREAIEKEMKEQISYIHNKAS